ncbi:MAG: hypothetical protein AAF387_04945 [Pseudomonadota bacterium]
MFDSYIGIDYSGARAPVSRLSGLQIYKADQFNEPARVPVPNDSGKHWTRKEIAYWCHEHLEQFERTIIGIDHGFSFPIDYFRRHELRSWDDFLVHFCELWPTDRDHMYVDFVRAKNPPSGDNKELRLCERWTPNTKSVFQFDVQGSVAKSTHAGLPWIYFLRRDPGLKDRLHFWPYDGFEIPEDKSVIAEIFPSLFRRRYDRGERTVDEHDAYSVAYWLRQMDGLNMLARYFNPPLTLPERRVVELEGWILGVT